MMFSCQEACLNPAALKNQNDIYQTCSTVRKKQILAADRATPLSKENNPSELSPQDVSAALISSTIFLRIFREVADSYRLGCTFSTVSGLRLLA